MESFDERPQRAAAADGAREGRLAAALRANGRSLLVLGALAVFLLLMAAVLAGGPLRIDALAHALVVERLRADWLTPVMEGFSALATPPALAGMLLIVAAFGPGRRPGWFCGLNLVLAALLNVVLKAVVQRPRPEGFRLAVEGGFSFPSGHSMAACAFFGLIVWLVWRYERDRSRRLLLTAALSFIILMVGVSRIYLGVHYASDVVAGFCASLAWLALYTRVAAPALLGDARADAAR